MSEEEGEGGPGEGHVGPGAHHGGPGTHHAGTGALVLSEPAGDAGSKSQWEFQPPYSLFLSLFLLSPHGPVLADALEATITWLCPGINVFAYSAFEISARCYFWLEFQSLPGREQLREGEAEKRGEGESSCGTTVLDLQMRQQKLSCLSFIFFPFFLFTISVSRSMNKISDDFCDALV